MSCGMLHFPCRSFLLYLWWVGVFKSGKSLYLTKQNLYCTLTSFRMLVMYALHLVTALYLFFQVLLLRGLCIFFLLSGPDVLAEKSPGNDHLPDFADTQLRSWNLSYCHQDNSQWMSYFDCQQLCEAGTGLVDTFVNLCAVPRASKATAAASEVLLLWLFGPQDQQGEWVCFVNNCFELAIVLMCKWTVVSLWMVSHSIQYI